MQHEIHTILNDLEQERKDNYKQARNISGIVLVICFILMSIMLLSSETGGQLAFFLILPPIFVYISYQKKYVQKLKNDLLPKILKNYRSNLAYDADQGISEETVREGKIVSLHSRFSSEDAIWYSKDNIQVYSSDLHIERRRSNGKRTSYVTTFRGQYYVFTFPRQFNGTHVIKESASLFKGLDWFSNLTTVELENIRFNEIFHSKTDNQQEFYYLLTPQMAEKVMSIEQKYPGKIGISIMDNTLHMAIHNNTNNFNFKLSKPLSMNYLKSFLEPIDIMEELLIDLDLYKNKYMYKKLGN